MIDTESLKKLVIDMATTGLLASYVEGDDTVDEILANLPPVSNKRKKLLEQSFDYDEKPSIPKHWKWVRLGVFSSYGDTPTKILVDSMKEQMWVLELEDIEVGGKLLVKKRFPDRKPAGEKTAFTKGQILYSKLRPYLKKVLVADEDGASTPELVSFDVFGGVNSQYISYCLINSYVDRMINKRSYGVKMPRVDAGFMVNLPIPLPPLAEQKRIVEKIEEILSQIDIIDTLQKQYESDREILKGKIIDAGIRGELTEQLPEDGDAEDLYAKIQKEKTRLIKEGKIKQEKPFPPISEDEIPFEIPRNWKWVRLKTICRKIIDGDHNPPSGLGEKTEYLMLSAQNINNDRLVNIENARYLSQDVFMEENKRTRLEFGDVLLTIVATLGRSCVYREKLNICFQRSVCVISTMIDPDYLKYFFDSKYIQNAMVDGATGAAQPGFYLNKVERMCIAIPPLAEQNRIVDRIIGLMGILIGEATC